MKILSQDQIEQITKTLLLVPVARRREAFGPLIQLIGGVTDLEKEFEKVVIHMGSTGVKPRFESIHNTDLIHVHRLSCSQQAAWCKGPEWFF